MKLPQMLTTSLVLAGALAAIPAHGSVIIDSTRVIYPLDEREVTVRLTNDSKSPSLVQVWIDDGDPDARPDEAKAPFVVTPPIFRMSAQKAQTLRLIYTGDTLPPDRESVYWLNVLDIPPRPSGGQAKANTLRFAFRTRIKIFARPARLEGTPESAPAQLRWRLVDAPDGKGQALQVSNPTPYHVSFSDLSVHAGGRTFSNERGGMAAPEGITLLPVPGLDAVADGAKVQFTAISDYSAPLPGEAPLAR